MSRSGRQLERTALSWSRTALAALALAGVSLKVGLRDDDAAPLVTGGLAGLAAGVLYLYGRVRSARSIADRGYGAPGPLRIVAGTCLAAQCAAVVAIGLHLTR